MQLCCNVEYLNFGMQTCAHQMSRLFSGGLLAIITILVAWGLCTSSARVVWRRWLSHTPTRSTRSGTSLAESCGRRGRKSGVRVKMPSMLTRVSSCVILVYFVRQASVVNHTIVTDPTIWQPGFDLLRHTWSLVNRFRTGRGPSRANLHKWGLTSHFPVIEASDRPRTTLLTCAH